MNLGHLFCLRVHAKETSTVKMILALMCKFFVLEGKFYTCARLLIKRPS